MPTASTSQILGNNECFEPYTSNLYVRRTLAGEFVCVSKHLLKDLIRLGLWTPALKNKLIAHNGSVQNLMELPQEISEIYKNVWEMKGKILIDMAAARGAFIDQSQSLNVHMTDTSYAKMTSMHFYAWKKGLKTGMYYLRTKAATDAIKFTVDQQMLREEKVQSPKLFESELTQTYSKRTEIYSQVKQEVKKTPKKDHSNFSDSDQSDTETSGTTRGRKNSNETNQEKLNKKREEALICSLLNKEECLSCSS